MIKLHPETAAEIVRAFDDYGLWSSVDMSESGENGRYATYRRAKAIMVLVDLGMTHCLSNWASEILADDYYTEAEYGV